MKTAVQAEWAIKEVGRNNYMYQASPEGRVRSIVFCFKHMNHWTKTHHGNIMDKQYTLNIQKKYEHLLEKIEGFRNLIINRIGINERIEAFANDGGIIPLECN